jgi:glycosyltransferase involved in cell wall biosynthesis
MTESTVTVIMSPRERFNLALRSLVSLYENTKIPFELIVVDGGSPRAIRRQLERAARERGFRLVRRDHFLTPNEARNLAIPQVTTRYIAFVDNDVIYSPGWLDALVACAEETGADIVGPLTCIGEPAHTRIHIAGGMFGFVEESGTRRFKDSQRFMNRPLRDVAGQLKREPCDYAEFHCMLARTALFERLGPLDEALKATREHLDFCLSAKRQGAKVWFEPRSVVTQAAPELIELSDIPFYLLRWSDDWAMGSMRHFMQKWDCQFDMAALRRDWIKKHRDEAIEPLRRPLRTLVGRRVADILCAPIGTTLEQIIIPRVARRRPSDGF